MGIEKYRVHEVAKDFGLPTKTITEILTKYAETPKNHMQALTDQELSLIFEYLTQHNQVSSIQTIFADTYKDAAKEAPAKKAEPAKSAAPGQGQGGSKQPAAKVPQNAQGGRQPAQQQAGAPAAAKPAAQQLPAEHTPQPAATTPAPENAENAEPAPAESRTPAQSGPDSEQPES